MRTIERALKEDLSLPHVTVNIQYKSYH